MEKVKNIIIKNIEVIERNLRSPIFTVKKIEKQEVCLASGKNYSNFMIAIEKIGILIFRKSKLIKFFSKNYRNFPSKFY